MKSSGGSQDPQKQLKARISNLEKSYELLKQKCASLETDNKRLENEKQSAMEEQKKVV